MAQEITTWVRLPVDTGNYDLDCFVDGITPYDEVRGAKVRATFDMGRLIVLSFERVDPTAKFVLRSYVRDYYGREKSVTTGRRSVTFYFIDVVHGRSRR